MFLSQAYAVKGSLNKFGLERAWVAYRQTTKKAYFEPQYLMKQKPLLNAKL